MGQLYQQKIMFFWLNLCWAIFCLLHIRKYTLAYSSHGIFAKLKSAKPWKIISLALSKRWTRVLWVLLSGGLPLDHHHHCQGSLQRVIPLLHSKRRRRHKVGWSWSWVRIAVLVKFFTAKSPHFSDQIIVALIDHIFIYLG